MFRNVSINHRWKPRYASYKVRMRIEDPFYSHTHEWRDPGLDGTPSSVYPPWYTFLFHKGRYVSRFVWRRVGKQSPQLSLARVTREVEPCVTDVKKWGLIVHLWRRESALASISRGPLFPLPPSPPSLNSLVNFWLQNENKEERKGRQAPLLDGHFVRFSIKTSCLFPRAFDSARPSFRSGPGPPSTLNLLTE